MEESNFKDVKCFVCNTVGAWENVDQFRYKKKEMCLCTHCGFVTYPKTYEKLQDLNEYYKEEYRQPPSANNLFSGERKLHYHGAFLDPLFQEWEQSGKKDPEVLEIGSAFGMFLRWMKQVVPGAKVHGTELTTSFRRNAYWMYGLNLTEWPDFSKKYDLICTYKVAEHIPSMDQEFRKYAEALTPDGKLYVSVPIWFEQMSNFGMSGFDLEYYYHQNHINVWSKNAFENVLKKSGLRIVRQNHCYYDSTYLCVRDDSQMTEPLVYDDVNTRREQLKKIKQATDLFLEAKFEEAIQTWPNFPDAHINNYESKRGKLHNLGFEEIHSQYLERALIQCPNSAPIVNFIADICMRYEKYDPALKYLQLSLDLKPDDPSALTAVGHCYRQMALKVPTEQERVKLTHEARMVMVHLEKTSQQMKFDAMTWLMQDNSKLPIPGEIESSMPLKSKDVPNINVAPG